MFKRIRPPVKYHGGKYYLSEWIISHFPKNKIYIEPFGGAASVLLNKPRSEKEIYSDADFAICNLFRCIQTNCDQLIRRLKEIPYDETTYYDFKERYLSKGFRDFSPVEQAAIKFVVHRMSRGGTVTTFSKSKRIGKNGIPSEENAWLTSLDSLFGVSRRLQNVEIECGNALDMILREDCAETLFYLDPPYVPSTRISKSVYQLEFGEEEHLRLIEVANQLVGKVIISGYRAECYDNHLVESKWRRKERSIPNHAAHGRSKERKIECLWMNF